MADPADVPNLTEELGALVMHCFDDRLPRFSLLWREDSWRPINSAIVSSV